MEKIKKMMGAFANIHNVYFRILFKPKESSQIFEKNIEKNIEKYLTVLEKEDLTRFLNNLGLFVQSYDIKFLTNNLDQYFLKVEILQPSFKRLIQNRSIECIFPNCNDITDNKNYNLCEKHLDDSIINNYEIMTQYLNEHIKKTKEIYNNYNNQKDIYSFLLNKHQDNIYFSYLSENFKNISCVLELVKYDANDSSNKEKLVEIELAYKVNKLKLKTLFNDPNTDADSDSSDSNSDSNSDSDADANSSRSDNGDDNLTDNNTQDCLMDLLNNKSDNINESYNKTITKINYIQELENNEQLIKKSNCNLQIEQDIININNINNINDMNDMDDIIDTNDIKSEKYSDSDSDSETDSETDLDSESNSIFNSDSDLSNLDFDSDIDLEELNELAKQIRMID
jgi:hypothetical protein